MEQLEIVTVPIIAGAVYLIITIMKQYWGKSEKFLKFIPLIAVFAGVCLGIICFYAFPDIMVSSTVFSAAVIGGGSGLSATGANQIFKQLTKKDPTENNDQPEQPKPTENNDSNQDSGNDT